jgi:hypothetical protein
MSVTAIAPEDEYEMRTCDRCGQLFFATKDDTRDYFGRRHICGDPGEPLVRSNYDDLDPLGQSSQDDLRK